ncbi:hypothetical protein BH09ACT6_BH09ACT6_03330 [soil metagenome]
MTAGESIKKGAEGTKNLTDKIVDAVEGKINDITDSVEKGLQAAGDKIHEAASQEKEGDE